MQGRINENGFLEAKKANQWVAQYCPLNVHKESALKCGIGCVNSSYLSDDDGSETFITCEDIEYRIKEAAEAKLEDFDLDIADLDILAPEMKVV